MFRSALVFLLTATSLGAQPGPVKLAEDGSWCWFGNPRALFKGQTLYFGYVRHKDARVALSMYDPNTGASTLLWKSEMSEPDDHDNPGLLDLEDGRLLAIYSKHGAEKKFYYRISNAARESIATNWSPELRFTNTSAGVTYANPYQLRAESGRIYNFMRNLNHNPTFVSSDSGTNWSEPRILIHTGNGRTRPYVQYCSDYDRRIDFIYTDGHPLAVGNSLYHAYYMGGSAYRSDGKLLKKLSDGPLEHDRGERGTVIYEFSAARGANPDDNLPSGRAWCWDLAYDSNGSPVAVFSVQRTNVMGPTWEGDRLYYYYARWTGTRWQKKLIAHAGSPLYEAERDYAGGITLDPNRPSVIYLSSNAEDPFQTGHVENVPVRRNRRYELYRGTTPDAGQTFTWHAITRNSTVDNLRPYVPRNNPYSCGLIWYAGEYRSYRDWNTSIYGLFTQASLQRSFSTSR